MRSCNNSSRRDVINRAPQCLAALILTGAPAGEQLLGSADIQSLADMAGSFEIVQQMRWVPFTLRDVLQLAAIAVISVLPLTLTMLSLQELLERLLKMIF
jgi:hypothetical protein